MRAGFKTDTLRHDKISPGLFLGMVEQFPLALAQATRITGPTLLQIVGQRPRGGRRGLARELFGKLAAQPTRNC